MAITSAARVPRASASFSASSGVSSPRSMIPNWLLIRRSAKNSFFWADTVPIFTSDQDLSTYSVIAALIHHMA